MHPKKLIFSSLFVLIGLGVLVFGGMKVLEASATQSWTAVEGESLEAVAVRQTGSKKTYPYEVRVRYAFEVAGEAYEGKRYNVHGAFKADSKAEADQRTADWAPGAAVTVYFDPDNPQASVLAQGGSGMSWIIVAMGVLMSGAGVFSALVPTRRR